MLDASSGPAREIAPKTRGALLYGTVVNGWRFIGAKVYCGHRLAWTRDLHSTYVPIETYWMNGVVVETRFGDIEENKVSFVGA